MYLVMGLDELGRTILMTQRQFECEAEARTYAESCAKAWAAFVVRRV